MVKMTHVTAGMRAQGVLNLSSLRQSHPTTSLHHTKALPSHQTKPIHMPTQMTARTCSAVASSEVNATQNNDQLVESLIEFLKEDLQHLFDDKGKNHY